MSKFTTELRYICETYAGYSESKGYANVDEIVTLAAPHVFDFSFPFYSNDSDKLLLEKKILKHFYTREICCETVGRWKLFLEDRLNTIMPYYNQLYESARLEFNPLNDTNYTVTHDGDIIVHGTSVGENSGDSNGRRVSTDSGSDVRYWTRNEKYSHWDLYSDTPQGGIAGITGAEDSPSLGDNAYLTNARHETHDGAGTGGTDTTNYGRANTTTDTNHNESDTSLTTDSSTDNTYSETIIGKRNGLSYSKMLNEYRETMLNIDKMVMNELNDLFFTLWE